MTLDFGFRSPTHGRLADRATIIAVGVMLATTPLFALLLQREAAMGRVSAWTAEGPPCPVISRAAFAAYGEPIRDDFHYEGVRYGMASGYARCAKIATDPLFGLGHGPICQFNDPTVIAVSGPGGEVFFLTRLRPATIVMDAGRPRCVLAAHLTPDWRRN
jgi:hypothetical protein